jgi:hypothetical protein
MGSRIFVQSALRLPHQEVMWRRANWLETSPQRRIIVTTSSTLNRETSMSALKWAVVALLIGSGAALAQGTQQTTSNGSNGGSGTAQPIGNSGAPVATGSNSYSPGLPAQSRIVIPLRRTR